MRVFVILALSLTGLVVAQEQPTFRAQSDLVVVHAMVEDRRGAAVADLGQSNFLVYEDNYPQEISFFSSTDAPASIGLLIDNSTSMSSKRERVIASAVQFAELSNPADEIFVLAFNEEVREAWAPRIIGDSDASVLRAMLLDRISARGKTALFDAINSALDQMQHAVHTRQVLVIVSDGSDNASRATRDATLARIQASNAMIYSVILHDPVDRDGDPRLLRHLSALTGGEAFMPRSIEDVPEALEHIARDIRATYTIGYVPRNQARDGTMRKLRVVASHPDGRRLKVQTRGGYIAPKAVVQHMEPRDVR
jgi:Ca-activated chloride channel family protein